MFDFYLGLAQLISVVWMILTLTNLCWINAAPTYYFYIHLTVIAMAYEDFIKTIITAFAPNWTNSHQCMLHLAYTPLGGHHALSVIFSAYVISGWQLQWSAFTDTKSESVVALRWSGYYSVWHSSWNSSYHDKVSSHMTQGVTKSYIICCN